MTDANTPLHPNSAAREFVVQYLYQSEIAKTYYFHEESFDLLARNFGLPESLYNFAKTRARLVLDNLAKLDRIIKTYSHNWSIERMAATDRNILRLSLSELMQQDTPEKVVINEAVELAKKFGTKDSGAFVNGLLDRIAKDKAHLAEAKPTP